MDHESSDWRGFRDSGSAEAVAYVKFILTPRPLIIMLHKLKQTGKRTWILYCIKSLGYPTVITTIA